MKQYLDLLQNIVNNGVKKESGRANMPDTIGLSNGCIKIDMNEGFPLLTTKKMFWKGIVHELLWFLRGDTNIKYLVDNNVNIWNGDAYRWYLRKREKNLYEDTSIVFGDSEVPYSFENFIKLIKEGNLYQSIATSYNPIYPELGELGKVYGHQWRNQNGIDQIAQVIDSLKTNPYSRYHIIDGWNKADFPEMALPPCHLLYQFIVRPIDFLHRAIMYEEKFGSISPDNQTDKFLDSNNIPKFYLDLNMYQRSCDTFLGVPFNIASMALLLIIVSKTVDMIPGKSNWIGGDTHLYENHLEAVNLQLSRKNTIYNPPSMIINAELNTLEDIEKLNIDHFKLKDYTFHPAIKAVLSTGI